MTRSALAGALLLACAGCNADGSLTGGEASGFHLVWNSPPAVSGLDWIGGTPAVDGGRVFVQEGNTLAALQASDGRRLWARRIRVASSPPPTTLLAANGRVYVSETDSVMAVDAATGTTIWTMHPDSQTVTVPALDATTLYTGQRGIPVVYALDASTGAPRWKVNVGSGYAFRAHVRGVAVSGDTVYAALERYLNLNGAQASGVVVALDRRDGHELWRYDTGGPYHYFLGAPLPVGGRILVNDFGSGDLVSIDVATQKEGWRTPSGGSDRVVLVGSTAITAGVDTKARGIDIQTGVVRWTGGTGSSPFGVGACGNNAYATAFLLRRYDVTTGAITGEAAAAADGGFVTNVVSDGTRIYLTGTTGVFAFTC